MKTKLQMIDEIEQRSKELIGTRYKYNILNGFKNYKSWKKLQLEEFYEKFLK